MPLVKHTIQKMDINHFILGGYQSFIDDLMEKAEFHGETIHNDEKFYVAFHQHNKSNKDYSVRPLVQSKSDYGIGKIRVTIREVLLELSIKLQVLDKKYLPSIIICLGSHNVNKKYNCYISRMRISVMREQEGFGRKLLINEKVISDWEMEVEEKEYLCYHIRIPLQVTGIHFAPQMIFNIALDEKDDCGKDKFTDNEWIYECNIEDYGTLITDYE